MNEQDVAANHTASTSEGNQDKGGQQAARPSLFSALYDAVAPTEESDTPQRTPQPLKISSLSDYIGKEAETEEPAKPAEAAPAKAPEEAPAEAAPKLVQIKKKAAPAAGAKAAEVDGEDLIAQPAPAERQPEAVKAEKPAEDPLLATLDEDDRYLYEAAAYAEAKLGKAKGEANRLLEYFRKRDEYVAKQKESDEDYDPLEDNDFARWERKNRPKVSQALIGEVERSRVKEDLEAQTGKVAADTAEQIRRVESKPKAELFKSKFAEKGVVKAMPDELLAEIAAISKEMPEGTQMPEMIAAVRERMPFEFEYMEAEMGKAKALAGELADVMTGAVPFDGRKGSRHLELAELVDKLGMEFAKTGEATRDGKRFVTRANFQRVKPESRHKYWTWSDEQVLDAVALETKGRIAAGVKAIREKAAKYTRPASQQPAPPAPPPPKKAPNPPAVRPGQMAGASEAQEAAPTKSATARLFGL